MELFILEDHQVKISPELRLVPQFKKIITRDKDRHKRRATAELAFIYFMYDYRSPYMAVPSISRYEQITKYLKIEDLKIDQDMQEAIDQYLEFLETPSIKALKSTKEALINASRVVDVMNEQINIALKDDEKNIDIAIETIDKLLTLSDKLPKTINTITLLEEKVQKEQHETGKIRGGGRKGEFED